MVGGRGRPISSDRLDEGLEDGLVVGGKGVAPRAAAAPLSNADPSKWITGVTPNSPVVRFAAMAVAVAVASQGDKLGMTAKVSARVFRDPSAGGNARLPTRPMPPAAPRRGAIRAW